MFLVLVAFFIVMMSLSFLTSFITIRFDIAGLSKDWLAFIGVIYNIGMTIGSFHASKLIAKLGFIRSYTGFVALIGLCMLCLGFLFEPFTWTALRFFIGYSLGAIFTIVETWIMMDSPDNKKGKAFSLYGFCLYLGYGFAPYLFHLLGKDYTTPYPLMIMAFLCFSSIVLITTTKSDSPMVEANETKLIIKETFLKAPIGFVQCMGSGIMNVIVYVFFPKIMFHHPSIHFTYLISFTILGGVLFQYPMGFLSDRYKRSDVLIGLNMAVAGLIPLCITFFNTLWLIPLLTTLGGCLFAIYPLTITLTCDQFKKKDYFNVVQTLLLVYGLGCIIGPIIATSIFLNLFEPVMGVFSAIFTINILLGIYSFGKRV